MDFLNNIDEETLLIVPTSIKKKVLKKLSEINRLVNVKLASFDELKRYVYFDYDIDAILYLMNKYDYIYENAKVLIDNMYFVNGSNYTSDKARDLFILKEELINNGLLIIDKLFINKYRSKKVIVFGYDFITKFNTNMLSFFNNVTIIENEWESINKRRVYSFKDINDESAFVVRSILDLLYEGISPNNIKVITSNSDYEKPINRLANLHNIPIVFSAKSSIFGTKIVSDYLKYLELLDFNETLEKLNNEYDLVNDKNNDIFNKLIAISNKFNNKKYDKSIIIEALKYDLKHTYIRERKYKENIEVVQLRDNYFDYNDHLFLIGFNQGEMPIIHKDEDYFSDKQKEELGIDDSGYLNTLEKDAITRLLSTYPNLTITYKKVNGKEECYPSSFITEFNYEEVSGEYDKTITYSSKFDELKFSMMLDNLIKFGTKDNDLELYFSNYVIPYLEYDNNFTSIDRDKLINRLKNKLILSYSSIDNFYRCGFRYYVGNILKLNNYEETFSIFIGKLFHDLLSRSQEDNFNFELEYSKYIMTRECSPKEEFFMSLLKVELEIIINRLKELYSKTELINIMTEKKIYIDKSTNDIEVNFMGIIDKIMYKEIDGETLIAIIDYKTGNPNLNLFNAIYGIEMQLIIYMYLIARGKMFEKIKFVGIYLQKILSSEVNINKNKSYVELKNDNLKLQGYSIDSEKYISRFDPTYTDSLFIKSMKITSNGFSSYTKLLSEEEIKSLIDLTDTKIDIARDSILNCQFDINPKQVGNENIGCAFCQYKDLCYMEQKNIVRLKEYDDLSFLGGDINA